MLKMVHHKFIKIITFCFISGCFMSCQNKDKEQNHVDLSGEWAFQMDSLDQGIPQKWYAKSLTESINLPGSMAENGKGNDITLDTHWTGNMWNDSLWYKSEDMERYRQKGNIKIPFWLSPEKVYTGAAWYQKKISIPENWKNKNINLHLERTHWETTLWVNDVEVGMQNTLATPHDYNLSDYLSPGEHTITLRVDNRVKDIDPGLDAHSISDNTQSNWNGIVGDIHLNASPKVFLKTIKISSDIAQNSLLVNATIDNQSEEDIEANIHLEAKKLYGNASDVAAKNEKLKLTKGINELSFTYPMGDNPELWDEFNPNTYQMHLALSSDLGEDTKTVDFGMRDFKVKDKHFSINGRSVFLRGTLECAIFPLTGYPPTNADDWKRIFKIIKNHGLNHMRFHSWCPPKAAFQAADEMGVYLQVEASAWATIGNGAPIDKWIYKEAEAIIEAYGNHPSFVMMAYGNEPSGENHVEYLTEFVDHMKALDNRRVYAAGAGWPFPDNADFFNSPKPRIQRWNENLNSIINKEAPQTTFDYQDKIDASDKPIVSHEIGQWCVYPNFKEMSKYTGVMKPKNFEIFKETLEENHLGPLADSLLLASGKLQTLCYKADIEAALRTKGFAGFQLLDLHDFPGQGTALIGVLDAFWDEKGYVSPEEFRAFSGSTVPLARLKKRIFSNDEVLTASLEVAHFGEKPLENITASWQLTNSDGDLIDKNTFAKKNIEIGNGIDLGEITVNLLKIKKATKLTLTVKVAEFSNAWDVWVYPAKKQKIENEAGVKVVSKLDQNALNYLQNGGKVLLNVTKGDIADDKGGHIGVGFSSIFWNTSWTKGQKPHTLGILCNPEHAALANFPTEYHSNWQWWDAMSNSNAIVLDDFTPDLKPIVRIVDDWFKNRRTALLFEAKVGNGKLLMSGIDLHTNLENRLEAQQLLYSLKSYMAGEKFDPETTLSRAQIQSLFK